MSLTEKSTKDNYIKLIVNTGRVDSTVSSTGEVKEASPYKEVDITDKILGQVSHFDEYSLLGARWQIDGLSGVQVFPNLPRLNKNIDLQAEKILDACMVNEKQKKAVKELFCTGVYDIINGCWKDLDFVMNFANHS